VVGNRADDVAKEIEAEARLDLYGYAGRSLGGASLACRIKGDSVEWHIGSRRIDRERAVALLRRFYSPPGKDGIPGPNPAQGDFFDPRCRSLKGPVSPVIPFQKPGWILDRHWEAFRKAASRESTYTVTITVKPTYSSLRQYIAHLLADETANALADAYTIQAAPEPVEVEEYVFARALSEQELKQHARYRSMGLEPYVWTAPRGTNIVVLKEYHKRFLLWLKACKAARIDKPQPSAEPRGCAM
jgi:hypothetical protein